MEKKASKTEVTSESLASIWGFHDIREVYFGTLVLAQHYYSGDKNKIWTSFKSLLSKKART